MVRVRPVILRAVDSHYLRTPVIVTGDMLATVTQQMMLTGQQRRSSTS